MIDNALEPMQKIMDRLRSEVPDLAAVYDAPDAVTVKENQVRTPNAQVIYLGYYVPSGDGSRAGFGAGQVIVQRWLIVLTVKNARDQVRKKDSLLYAGVLFMAVFKALAGWAPIPGMKPLKLATPPEPSYAPAFSYIPVAFEGHLILTTE